jgi:hypothetical protein
MIVHLTFFLSPLHSIIPLIIMLNISKKNQLPKTHDQLSDLIITKNTPIRNYSTCIKCVYNSNEKFKGFLFEIILELE